MDETREYYAKWNKAGSERQISYDLTYKWNLINKTNKLAKQKQRHRNKEQTDSKLSYISNTSGVSKMEVVR